jgi:beta-glucosidase
MVIMLFTFFLTAMSCRKSSTTDDTVKMPYLNPALPVDERVEDLLSRMTLDEKIGQMTQADRRYLLKEEDIRDYFLGSILSGGGSTPDSNVATEWADMVDRYQNLALQTRLKIPMIYGIDAVHGHNNVYGAVIFPHNIGLGCARNAGLVEKAARITALEVAGTGIHWTFAPCVAVPRDERWGRMYEGFGEDPDLVRELGAAAVRGYQGKELNRKGSVLACAKHYLGDGGTRGGVDQGDTVMDEETLRGIHMPGYVDAIREGVGSVMASFSSWNGRKMHGHTYLLTTVLRDEMGFDGIVVSDWQGIDQLPGDYADDVETAINAGIDMVMVPERYIEFIDTLKQVVLEGRVSGDRVDSAVRRILKIKFMLGLFENPFTDRELTALVGSDEHRLAARECVRQSLVLLKNEGSVLPLSGSEARIHVGGRNADDLGAQCGGWTISWQGERGATTIGTTVYRAVKERAPAGTEVTYSLDGKGAEGADVCIAVIGEDPYAEGEGDRKDLRLDREDVDTVRRMKKAGAPVIVILITGRPMILDAILDLCDALVVAWLPGTEGEGVADVLFGDFAPSGKLSNSWPGKMSQVPVNLGDPGYNPLYEYGYGLTY